MHSLYLRWLASLAHGYETPLNEGEKLTVITA
jgi:hypothetical protein